ncbi:unnamed protein product [Hermetia illucens]|uniref:Uncharacterized protein n=1 Tax=Hermetia illucens TaxID=343691 RepID=A0A7R8UL37_HERIL|nr:unnamed protein product [Hermetia illucens]
MESHGSLPKTQHCKREDHRCHTIRTHQISNKPNFPFLKLHIENVHKEINEEQAHTLGTTLNHKETLPEMHIIPNTPHGETLGLNLKGTDVEKLGHTLINLLKYSQEDDSKVTLLDPNRNKTTTHENIQTTLHYLLTAPELTHPEQLLFTKLTLKKPEIYTPTKAVLNFIKNRNSDEKRRNLLTADANIPTTRIDDDVEIINTTNNPPSPTESEETAKTISNNKITKIIDRAMGHLAINTIATHNNRIYAFQNMKYVPGNPLGEFLSNTYIRQTIGAPREAYKCLNLLCILHKERDIILVTRQN